MGYIFEVKIFLENLLKENKYKGYLKYWYYDLKVKIFKYR